MSALFVGAVVLGISSAVSGWFVFRGSGARTSGAGLVTGGLITLAGCAADVLDLGDCAPLLFRIAGYVAFPFALLSYPRSLRTDPVSFILSVIVLSSGVISVMWGTASEPLGYVIVCGLLADAWWSFERAEDEARRALTWSTLAWVGSGIVAAFVVFVAESTGSNVDRPIAFVTLGLIALCPPAMAIGVVRPHLVDVQGLVTLAVVDATVFVTYLASAIGLVSIAEQARGAPLDQAPVVVVCALLAFGLRPLQVTLRGVVDELLFGNRPDPLAAATTLADRIGDDPALALDAIREALVLPYASLRMGGELLATSGNRVTHTRALPLKLYDDAVGEVVVGLRAGDLGLSAADEDVLRIVAPLLAQTLRARAMSRDLQQSREAVVTAVEEERRRLRRDLHDGLGPTLTGVAFSADAARNQLASNPSKADELLSRLRADTADAIKEVRRLVEGLRPPALDELGLVAAVRQYAVSLHASGGELLSVDVVATHPMPKLSAAVEVATYRIVVEALTNVVRHAAASVARVEIVVSDECIELSVTDNGLPGAQWRPGAGITSMTERCQHVGGTLTLEQTDRGGTVRASIPLHAGNGPC